MIWSILTLLTIQCTDTKTVNYLKYLYTRDLVIENPHGTYEISKLVCLATHAYVSVSLRVTCAHTHSHTMTQKNPKNYLK